MAKRKRLKPRKRTVPVPSAVPSTSRHCPCLSTFTQGAIASCSGDGPSFRLSLPSASSMRPPQKPSVLPPILSMATFPERIMRSPQDKESPYFSFMGSRSSRALSRFPLSGQLDSGSKRIRPPSVDIYIKWKMSGYFVWLWIVQAGPSIETTHRILRAHPNDGTSRHSAKLGG